MIPLLERLILSLRLIISTLPHTNQLEEKGPGKGAPNGIPSGAAPGQAWSPQRPKDSENSHGQIQERREPLCWAKVIRLVSGRAGTSCRRSGSGPGGLSGVSTRITITGPSETGSPLHTTGPGPEPMSVAEARANGLAPKRTQQNQYRDMSTNCCTVTYSTATELSYFLTLFLDSGQPGK